MIWHSCSCIAFWYIHQERWHWSSEARVLKIQICVGNILCREYPASTYYYLKQSFLKRSTWETHGWIPSPYLAPQIAEAASSCSLPAQSQQLCSQWPITQGVYWLLHVDLDLILRLHQRLLQRLHHSYWCFQLSCNAVLLLRKCQVCWWVLFFWLH